MDCFKTKWLRKLKVFKTHTKLFVVGSNIAQTRFRIITVDRTEPLELLLSEDDVEYNFTEINDIMASLQNGNNGSGKWKKSSVESFTAYGIVGFVRFREGYYAIFITKQRKSAEIGSHSVYKIEDTLMVYLPNQSVRVAHPDESRYLKMFQTVDLSSDFYFSFTYDLTNSLQYNMIRSHKYCQSCQELGCGKTESSSATSDPSLFTPCKRFVWNNHLTNPVLSDSIKSLWMLYIIHGHVVQSCINVYGQQIYITLIARRSSSYAGTRFLKRGCNVKGDVANEVETEQIVHCASISCIHRAPFTSYVQHRGSVPLHWEQDMSANVVPSKPPITITNNNPYAQATGCHFRQMLERFGAPIIALNLVRKREKRFRESLLGHAFKCAVEYLNQFLKTSQQIKFFPIDMAQLARGRKPTVMAKLANIAQYTLLSTGIFQSKPDLFQNTLSQNPRWRNLGGHHVYGYRLQTGVLRTNCVDCLDRTNSAQFIVGKCALAFQLYSLGVLSEPDISFDTDVTRLYEEMFETHGDIVALQYGGSQLVHTIRSYRGTEAQWASHSRDIVTAISRYYTNAFSDADKQAAINLFLGVFRPSEDRDNLWDFSTDHYLHNPDHEVLSTFFSQHYTRWWNPDVLRVLPLPFELVKITRELEKETSSRSTEALEDPPDSSDCYNDLHNPFELTFFEELFAMNLPSTYSAFRASGSQNRSPFVVRKEARQETDLASRTSSPTSSLASMDLSSNESSDCEIADEANNVLGASQATKTDTVSPWFKIPTLKDFSSRSVYGIDLDNHAAKEDMDFYENYLACVELHEQASVPSDADTAFVIDEPEVDIESLALYKESVYHTYEPDRQFYVDYLTSYKAV